MANVQLVSEVRTYRLIEQLVAVQGWLARASGYKLLAQQEYRAVPALNSALANASKTGKGRGQPEYVLVRAADGRPLAVFEGKAHAQQIKTAVDEAIHYADALRRAGFNPVAVAVAGTDGAHFEVRVLRHSGTAWSEVTYEGTHISWVPGPDEMARIAAGATELRPKVPPPEVLREKAEKINGLLRESGLKDDFRPAVIGAIMLALWKDGANIRRDPSHILRDINQACVRAFQDAGKPDLAKSIRVDEANEKLAVRVREVAEILEILNIRTLTAEHDYIGALYEEFFRYTGGNTIGQYFTPRHIARFMAELCEVTAEDIVLDISCGTGGFLIAAMQQMQETSQLSREQIIKIVNKHLIGLETEPVTAALCVANMILRGDGTTGVRRTSAFNDATFPFDDANVVLMNPPFPHKKTDDPPEKFVSRALDGLKRKGLCAAVVPMSLLCKREKGTWRQDILRGHRLEAVFSLPDELFQPYAAATTAVILLRKGVPHGNHHTFFCRIANDGFRLKKGTRVDQPGSEIRAALAGFQARSNIPEFCSAALPSETAGAWHPGAYIQAAPMGLDACKEAVGQILRNRTAFVVRFSPSINRMLAAIQAPETTIAVRAHAAKAEIAEVGAIGSYFTIGYGQRELHSKDGLVPGPSLVVSSSGIDNGCYGFFDFDDLLRPPFVTVPSTGSIGEAAVQTLPCGVVDDCLVLVPRAGVPIELLYVAAATLRHEAWRFDYGRKMTPKRIAGFLLPSTPGLLDWIADEDEKARDIEGLALDSTNDPAKVAAEDARDVAAASAVLAAVAQGGVAVVKGSQLVDRLSRLPSN